MNNPKVSFMSRSFATVVVIGGFVFGTAQAGGSHGDGHGLMFGAPGDADEADRTVEIVMTDNKFSVPALSVKDGETVRFVVENRGQLVHEFNIGVSAMHEEHQREMLKMFEQGTMDATSINHEMMGGEHSHMKHDDSNSILLEPGKSAELTWTFKQAHELEFACNVPGHYQLGMVGTINFTN